MRLKEVRIKNFRGYGENLDREDRCYTFEKLDSDFVLFQGFNGFGKTSFFEAVEWCMTDQIGRLHELYQKKTYTATEMKNSHYLKFHHPLKERNKERTVMVELIFDNGLEVKRTSQSHSLRMSKSDSKYQSELYVTEQGKLLVGMTTQGLLRKFIFSQTAPDPKQFVNIHLLGQDRISDFLSDNKPEKRRSVFMQLLNLEEINQKYTTLDGFKKKSPISSKKTQVNNELVVLREHKRGIDQFLDSRNFENMEMYLSNLRARAAILHPLIQLALDKGIRIKKVKLATLLDFGDILVTNSVKYLHQVSKLQTAVQEENITLLKRRPDLLQIRETLTRLLLWEQLHKVVEKSTLAQQLNESNYDNLMKEGQEIDKQLKAAEALNEDNQSGVVNLTKYKKRFAHLKNWIDTTGVTISDDFWKKLNEEKLEWNKFKEQFGTVLKATETDIKIPDFENTNWGSLQTHYNNETKSLQKLNEKEVEIQQLRNGLSQLNEQYQQTLDQVRTFLGQQEVSICPVCWNEDFSHEKYNGLFVDLDDNSVNQKLLALIGETISRGDASVQEIDNQLQSKKHEILVQKEKIQKQILLKIQNSLDGTVKNFLAIYERVKKYYQEKNDKIQAELTEWKEKNRINKENLKRLETSFGLLFGKEFRINSLEPEELTVRLQSFLDDRNAWFLQNKEKLELEILPSIDEIVTKIQVLKEAKGIGEYLPGKVELLTRHINQINEQIQLLENMDIRLITLLTYKVPEQFEGKFAQYAELEGQIGKLEAELQKTEEYDRLVDQWHQKISALQKEVVNRQLKSHPFISWVYETINPHPFYSKLVIADEKKGTIFTSEGVDIYLDQIFSAAQLNILALSVFLGLGLSQMYSNLEQLFLDDPIQSMDDVNILAFIDVLRAIMDSKHHNKKMILSTHNDNFAQLLTIKMRNRDFVHYKFKGYGEEGPLVVEIPH